VEDVRAFVQRLPPVVGYPVDWELRKKYIYLTQRLRLTTSDLVTFPAYFSHPLHDRIVPRLEFMQRRGRRVNSVLLRVALTMDDASFAKNLMGVSEEEYKAFRDLYRGWVKARRVEAKKGKKPAPERSVAQEEDEGRWDEEMSCFI
jgi:hypothetical protein